jgi:hypothetical protein
MQEKQKTSMDRRTFLRGVGGASTAAAAVAAASLAPGKAHAYNPGEEEARARYNPESDHIKAFYRVNSYPTKK